MTLVRALTNPTVAGAYSAVTVPAPTGTYATDAANTLTALAAGSVVLFQPGTYALHNIVVPNNRLLVIPPDTTIQMPANTATAASPYRIFTASTPATNVTFLGGGTIDGNRRNGNHGLSEDIFGIDMADAQRVTISGLRFYNWRGEGAYFGHVTTAPDKVKILGCTFEDCGVKETGDSGNARQGVAFIAGTDLVIEGNNFDTIGGYGVDLEGNGATDTFDNCVIGGNTYRDCAQGPINVVEGSGAAAPTNIDIRDRVAEGSLGIVNTFVKPSALLNIQRRLRTAGDLTLTPGDTSWHDVPSIGDITLKGVRAGDLVEVGVMSYWDNANTYRNLDVVSVVSGSPVTYFSVNSATPGEGGGGWRGAPAAPTNVGGSLFRAVTTSDVASGGVLTLRLRYKLNTATTTVLSADGAQVALHFWAHNHGATP